MYKITLMMYFNSFHQNQAHIICTRHQFRSLNGILICPASLPTLYQPSSPPPRLSVPSPSPLIPPPTNIKFLTYTVASLETESLVPHSNFPSPPSSPSPPRLSVSCPGPLTPPHPTNIKFAMYTASPPTANNSHHQK